MEDLVTYSVHLFCVLFSSSRNFHSLNLPTLSAFATQLRIFFQPTSIHAKRLPLPHPHQYSNDPEAGLAALEISSSSYRTVCRARQLSTLLLYHQVERESKLSL